MLALSRASQGPFAFEALFEGVRDLSVVEDAHDE